MRQRAGVYALRQALTTMDATSKLRLPARNLHAWELGDLLRSQGLRRCEEKLGELYERLRPIEQELAYAQRDGVTDDSALLAERRVLKTQIAALEAERTSHVWHSLLPQLEAQRPPQAPEPQSAETDQSIAPPPLPRQYEPFMAPPKQVEQRGGRLAAWARSPLTWAGGVAALTGVTLLGIVALYSGANHATPTARAVTVNVPKPAAPAVKTPYAAFSEKLDVLVKFADGFRVSFTISAYAPIRERLDLLRAEALTLSTTQPDAIARFNWAAIRIGAMTYRVDAYEGAFLMAGLLGLPEGASLEQKTAIVQSEISALDIALHDAIRRTYTSANQVPEAFANLVDAFRQVRSHIDALNPADPKVRAKRNAFDTEIDRALQAHFAKTYADGSVRHSVIQGLPPPFTAQAPSVRFPSESSDAIRSDLAATVRDALALKTAMYTSEQQVSTALAKLYDRAIYAVRADASKVLLLGDFNAALSVIHGHTYARATDGAIEDIRTPPRFELPHDVTPELRHGITKLELDALAQTVRADRPALAVAALTSDLQSIYQRIDGSELKSSTLVVQYNAVRQVLAEAAVGKVNRLGQAISGLLPPALEAPVQPSIAPSPEVSAPAVPVSEAAAVRPLSAEAIALQNTLDALVAQATEMRTAKDVYADEPVRDALKEHALTASRLGEIDPSAIAMFNSAVIRIKMLSFLGGSVETDFRTPRLLSPSHKGDVAATVIAIADEVRTLDAALSGLTQRAFGYRDQVPLQLASLSEAFDTVRNHIEELTRRDAGATADLVAQFDSALLRARSSTFERTYADETKGTTIIHDLPSPFAASTPDVADTTSVQKQARTDLASVVAQARAIKSGDFSADAPIKIALSKLHDRVISAVRAQKSAAALIGDYNAARITIRAHTFTNPKGEPEIILTPPSIRTLPGTEPATRRKIIEDELRALDAVADKGRPAVAIERLIDDLDAVHSNLGWASRDLRSEALVAKYNAARNKMANAAEGKPTGYRTVPPVLVFERR